MSSLQNVFRALSDPSRREILRLLNSGDLTIAQISENFPFTRAAVKKHLKILEDSGLVSVTTNGRERINHLNKDALQAITDWVDNFNAPAEDRLSALKRSIAKEWNT